MMFVGLVWSLALLVAVAGYAKLVAPDYTAGALAALGFRWVRHSHVRLLAVVEIAVGVTVIATGLSSAVAALTLFYVGFTVFVVLALARDTPLSSCGCFGRPDTPPTSAHLVVNAVSAGLLGWVAATASRVGVGDVLAEYGSGAVPIVLSAGTTTYLLYLLLSFAPSRLPVVLGRASS
ncbi:MAG: hypothetical protein OEO77_02350 [Acidimicrobiia bacterium]|nr:hypothetical protein [Acidimicrobiia bacterium]